MFLDEVRLAARIRHPNGVQTLDVVATDDDLSLVMDYVQGESLARSFASRHRPVSRPIRAWRRRSSPGCCTASTRRTRPGASCIGT
jgi:serine/threonine-protein kinase